jgi:hypothetical protein
MAQSAQYAIDGEYAMSLSRLALITLPLLMAAGFCSAEMHEHAHGEELMQMQSSHVHGEVILNVVLEDDRLDVEMISPAMNITGFEHAPSTEQERQAVDDAIAKLQQAGNLLALPGTAGCEPGASTVETSLKEEHAHHGHDHEPAAEQGHDGDHAEFHVTHAFQCDKPGAIDSLNLTLFSHFPGVEKVRLQWIHGQRQGAAVVEPGNTAVTFE